MAISLSPVHILNHPDKLRWYSFRPLESGIVEVVRRDGTQTTFRRQLSKQQARGRYKWLLKLGYVKW